MVAKEIDPFKTNHDYEEAGLTAQKRVSGHLKASFENLPKALEKCSGRIFNGLRFEHAHYAILIDHLIVHQHGIILIENRAEPADIKVNPIGEWTQVYQEKELRISSPLSQGERKITFLRTLLEQNSNVLRPTLRKSEGAFEAILIDMIVIIANEGKFELSRGMSMPRVCRLDDVGEKVVGLMLSQRKASKAGFFAKRSQEKQLNEDELFKVTAFLKQRHAPIERDEVVERFKRDNEETGVLKADKGQRDYLYCQSCGGNQLYIDHEGEYRVVCLDCSGIMVIDRTCSSCGSQGFVSRNENNFFIECEACLSAELIFVDPVR